MTTRRVAKMSEAIRGVVSMAILTQLNDPRIEHVTVTSVEVSGDMRSAKVNVSIMGDEKKQNLVLHGLKSSCGFLQSKIADRLDTRYIPKLSFVLDSGIKSSAEISRILAEVLPKNETKDETKDETETDCLIEPDHNEPDDDDDPQPPETTDT